MAIITLANAAGSPGTTTAALALAISWHRPVLLLEADPAGVSAISAGWFKGNPPHNHGLVNLAVAHRNGDLPSALRENSFQLDQFPVTVVPGVRSPAQTASTQALWEPLVPILQDLDHNGMDVIVDAGRLIACASPWPVIRASDALLLTSRTTLPALAGAKVWGNQLSGELETVGMADHLALLMVGEGRPFTAKEFKKRTGLSTVAALAWDPVNAQKISDGDARRLENPGFHSDPLAKGSYGRSVRAAASAIQTMVAANRDVLAGAPHTPGGPR